MAAAPRCKSVFGAPAPRPTGCLAGLGALSVLLANNDEAVMDIPKQQEQSAEERIGTMIGKIMVLALITFFVWAYASTLVAKLGLF